MRTLLPGLMTLHVTNFLPAERDKFNKKLRREIMNVMIPESNYCLYLAIWQTHMVYIGVCASYQNKFRWISNTS